mgnify:CR=1 FL=1
MSEDQSNTNKPINWVCPVLRQVQRSESRLRLQSRSMVREQVRPHCLRILLSIDSTIEQDNHCVKSMWGENHAHEFFATLQIWLLVP